VGASSTGFFLGWNHKNGKNHRTLEHYFEIKGLRVDLKQNINRTIPNLQNIRVSFRTLGVLDGSEKIRYADLSIPVEQDKTALHGNVSEPTTGFRVVSKGTGGKPRQAEA